MNWVLLAQHGKAKCQQYSVKKSTVRIQVLDENKETWKEDVATIFHN